MDAAVRMARDQQPAGDSKPDSVADAKPDPVAAFGWLPCHLTLEIPIVKFTVGDLLRLNKNSVVETACPSTGDIPLRVNGLLIGWSEFEVVGERLAVRITELA
jgi:flagellar motor switch/type III secretory pathway protein FliN